MPTPAAGPLLLPLSQDGKNIWGKEGIEVSDSSAPDWGTSRTLPTLGGKGSLKTLPLPIVNASKPLTPPGRGGLKAYPSSRLGINLHGSLAGNGD